MNSVRIVGMISTVAIIATSFGMMTPPALAQTVSVEVTATPQTTFNGFGAAISNPIGEFLPAGGRADTPGSVANSIYNLLLSPNDPASLNLSYLRLGVNTDNYEQSNTSGPDFSTSVVKMGEADIINAAKTRNPAIKLFFNAGTPPAWMKENGADYNANDPVTFSPDAPTTNHLLATQEGAYADLMDQYTEDFESYFGYPIDALSIQNEPDVNVNFYGCCLYPDSSTVDPYAATYLDTLNAVRTDITQSSPTQLWGPECTSFNNNTYYDNTDYFNSAAATNQLSALCTHSYGNDYGSPTPIQRNGLDLNMTEYSLYDDSFQVNGQTDQAWMASTMADQFCKDVNDGQVASWFWWNMVGVNNAYDNGPANTGQSLIIVNGGYDPSCVYKSVDITTLNNDSVSDGPYESPWQFDFGTDNWFLTSKYYAFRRLTQSILPGSVNMLTNTMPNYQQANGGQDDVYAAAFKLPSSGKYCVVIANKSGNTYTTTLTVDELTSAAYTALTAYYTSENGSTPVNDASWNDGLTNGQLTTTAWAHSVLCYVQQ